MANNVIPIPLPITGTITATDAGSRDIFSRDKVSIDSNQIEIPYDDSTWANFVDQTASGGAPAASQANGQVTVSSGTGANGTRIVISKDMSKYRLGQEVGWGGTFRFDAAGVVNADVFWGAMDDVDLTNAVLFGHFNGTWAIRYRRGGSTVWTKEPSAWVSGWETAYGATFDKTKNQIARIRAGLFGHRGFVVELASPVTHSDGSINWVTVIDQTGLNAEAVPVFTNNDLKVGMGVKKTGADATNLSVTSACQAGWTASEQSRLSETLTDRTLASRVIAALVGRTNAGAWVGVNVNNQGRLFVTNDSVSATGAAVPASATLLGLSDAGTLRALIGDTSGRVLVGSETLVKNTVTVSASGDTTLHTPASGKKIRLYFFGYSAGSAVTGVVVGLKLEGYNAGAVFDNQYLSAAGQPYARSILNGNRYVEGSIDGRLIVNLSAAQGVYVNFEFEEV